MKFNFIFLLTILASLSSCGGDEWIGIVYPSSNDLTVHTIVGKFSSLEQCRDAAESHIVSINRSSIADYECGLNCRDSNDPIICEKTAR